MAFGKKKQDVTPDGLALGGVSDEDAVSALYPIEPAAPENDEGQVDEEPMPVTEVVETPIPAPDSSDALLSMFQETQVESTDRIVLVEMAGEVELDDLLEELQTVAAAMGISAEMEAAA